MGKFLFIKSLRGVGILPAFQFNLDAEHLSYFLISRIGEMTPSGNLGGTGDISILCML